MAITFEEEKNKINWVAVIGIILVIGILLTTVIYLFFINPPAVDTLLSSRVKKISEVQKTKFNFEEALSNPALGSLNALVELSTPSPENVGKANPFLP